MYLASPISLPRELSFVVSAHVSKRNRDGSGPTCLNLSRDFRALCASNKMGSRFRGLEWAPLQFVVLKQALSIISPAPFCAVLSGACGGRVHPEHRPETRLARRLPPIHLRNLWRPFWQPPVADAIGRAMLGHLAACGVPATPRSPALLAYARRGPAQPSRLSPLTMSSTASGYR